MTAEEYREFYLAELRKLRLEHCLEWSKPLVQKELDIKAFGCLVEKIKSDLTAELAKQYLDKSIGYDFT